MSWVYALLLGWVAVAVVYFLACVALPFRCPNAIAIGVTVIVAAILEAILLL